MQMRAPTTTLAEFVKDSDTGSTHIECVADGGHYFHPGLFGPPLQFPIPDHGIRLRVNLVAKLADSPILYPRVGGCMGGKLSKCAHRCLLVNAWMHRC